MAKNFITGNAQRVRFSVERVAELRKRHPEWDTPPSPKALARERLKPVEPLEISPAHRGDKWLEPLSRFARRMGEEGARGLYLGGVSVFGAALLEGAHEPCLARVQQADVVGDM